MSDKMKFLKYLYLVLSIFLLTQSVSSKNYRYSARINLEIDESGNNTYNLKYEYNIIKRFTVESEDIRPFEPIYDNPYAKISKVTATLNDEKIKKENIYKISLSNQDEYFTEDESYVIKIPPETEKGDILSYSYKFEYDKFPYPKLLAIPNADSILSFEINISHPDNLIIDYEFLKFSKDISVKLINESSTKTSLSIEPVSGFEPLEYFEGNDILGLLSLIYYDSTKSSDESFFSPKGYVNWFKALTDINPSFNNFKDSSLLNEIESQVTDFDKIKFISNYVQDNLRYIAIGRQNHAIIPFSPDLILANKYGDCKDRAALVSALARSVGLDVYMTLVTSNLPIKLKTVHPSYFNHVICCYINNSDTIFFDPTATYYRFPMVPEGLIGHDVMVIKDDPFIKKLSSSLDPYMIELTIDGSIDSLDDLNAVFKLRNFFNAEYFKNKISNKTNYQNYFNGLLSAQFQKIKFTDFDVVDSDEYELTVRAKADLSRLVVLSPTKCYIPKTQFAVYDKLLMKRADNPNPIHFIGRKNFILNISLTDFADSTSTDSLIIDRGDYGYYRSDLNCSFDTLKINSQLIRPLKIIEAKDKQKHIDFCQDYNNEKNNLYIIDKVRE